MAPWMLVFKGLQQQKACCNSEGLCEGPQCVSWTCGCLLYSLTKQETVRLDNKVQVEATCRELQSEGQQPLVVRLLRVLRRQHGYEAQTLNGVTAELPSRCLLPQL